MEKARSIKVGGLLCLFPERQVHSARPMCTESFSFSLVWGCPSAKNKPGHRCAASLVNAQTKRQLRLFFSQKRDNCNGKKYGNLVKPFRNQVKCFRWPNLTSIKYHFFLKYFQLTNQTLLISCRDCLPLIHTHVNISNHQPLFGRPSL